MSDDSLSAAELERYARQIAPGVLTVEGQLRLKRSTALITRAGGMGGPAALALVMAGVGRVIIAHGGDMISPDLNRQVLGSEAVIGHPRAEHFAAYLRTMNRFVEVEALDHEPDDEESLALARLVDVIISAPPNFAERMRLNRAAVAAGVPLVDAAQWAMMGSVTIIEPGKSACLACIYPREPEFEELFPVVGAISSTTGSLAALEAIKLLSGCGHAASGQMLVIDGFFSRLSQTALRRDPDCPVCGKENAD